jgi:hypothetical protein
LLDYFAVSNDQSGDYNRIRIHGSNYDFSPYEYMEAVKRGPLKPEQMNTLACEFAACSTPPGTSPKSPMPILVH